MFSFRFRARPTLSATSSLKRRASGVPVIVSDTGGPKELVESNVNGVVTKSHDVDDLARATRELVAEQGEAREMSRQARQAVVDRSWPGAFRKVLGCHRNLTIHG